MQITQHHSQSSPFFAEDKKYLRFQDYLASNHIDPRRIPFTQLSFKVCGYGYFQKYKTNMKLHFRQYLWESIHACSELHTLKVIFNGFSVNSSKAERQQAQQLKMAQDHILLDIIQAISDIARKKKFKVFHLHTTNLRNCTMKDLQKLFNLICIFGEDRCQEISIQLTDWQFEEGYPEYNSLVQIFTNFVANRPANLTFKKFRLEISSWYMKQKQAYKFLSQSLTNEQIVDKFKNQSKSAAKIQEEKKPVPVEGEAANNQEGQNINSMQLAFPNLPSEQQEETMNALLFYLEKLDQRYFKPKYPYKINHQKYSQEDHGAFDAMLKEVKIYQTVVSKRLVKYPTQFIQQLRVDEFHRKMLEFLSNLLIKLNLLQEYHIDLRNWNSTFSMSGLKKILDTKVISNKQEFSLIRRSLINNKNQPQNAGDEIGLKTIYNM